jgi:cellulose synthase/poly-beta-1,6-N-acetylglucosamine synthase-like glycosyltransferase
MSNVLVSLSYPVFVILFSYFVLLVVFSFFLSLIGIIEGRKRSWESEEEDYPLTYLSSAAIPVSIIMPAANEEAWIRDSILSVLNLNYPKLEIIIVDDNSKDNTFQIINGMLGLYPVDVPYIKHYQDGQVRVILKSKKYPHVTVIRKLVSSSKAGAVNAGLNLAKYDYVCMVDADTILEPNAILKVMAPVGREPEKIIGVGSYFALSNYLNIKDGMLVERSFSFNPIVAYQNIEYIRSFIGSRLGWSRYNAMPVVAGGFNMWRRDVLYNLGGFALDFTCEDIEFTFRAQDYMAKNKDKNYKIIMLPYFVGRTDGPANISSLISQRSRWQRVTNETVARYKYMVLNPRYGWFAFLTLPYFVFYEVLGVFFELAGFGFSLAGWLSGLMDIRTFAAFVLLMLLTQMSISLFSILSFVRIQRVYRLSYIFYLLFLSFVEIFFYRWIIYLGKLHGTYTYFLRRKDFNRYQRKTRNNVK